MNTVYAQPHADFNISNVTSCLGSVVNFTDISTAPNNTVQNNFWDFGDGNTGTGAAATHTYAVAGTYNVKHWITSTAGCMSDTMTKPVTVVALPVVSFTNSLPVCQASNILFTSTSNPSAGTISQYNWSVNGSPTGGNTATMSYTPPASGSINVTLSVTTSNGCINQATQTVSVSPRPLASFNFGNACLPSGTMQFTGNSTISDGSQASFTYAWTFGDGGTANTQSPSHNYIAAGPYNVTLVVTSNNGCTDDTIRVVNTIYVQPTGNFTAPAEVCNGTSVSFTDISTAPNSTVTGWAWTFGDGGTSTSQNPTHTYASAGSYTVTLTVTSAVGCTSTVGTRTVVVNPLPTANFNISAPGCINQTVTFTDISSPNAGNLNNWSWTFGDAGTSALQNPTHAYAATGSYTVTLQVKTDKGCISTVVSKPVTISPKPVANFGLPESCLNDPFSSFTDSSTISDGTQAQFTYAWNFGDPNANAGNPNTSTLKNPQHKYTVAGPYTVTLTVTSNNGCSNTISRPFFVNGAVPVPSFTVQGGATSFCSNSGITLVDNSSVNPGSVVKLEIYWDYTNDPTIKITDDDPLPGKLYNHSYPEFGIPASRNVTIRYVVYSGQTCVQFIDKIITLYATPTIQFNTMNGICKDVPAFQITQASITNGLPGTGTYTGTGVSTTGIFDPNAAGDGIHSIRYTYTTSNGCTNFMDQTIEVYPVPVANAGPDKVVLQGGYVVLTPALNAGFPVSYFWSPSTGLDDPNSPTPRAAPPTDITYTLTVTSDKGCSSSDQVFVKQLKAPIIPNIFSPNGDGVHDKWEVNYLDSYPGCTVDIFNRYGQLIYHSEGYANPWDGTVNGKPVPVGTYYYIINPKNGRSKMTGYVDVIR
jgi:gliding motility-associated-like protein